MGRRGRQRQQAAPAPSAPARDYTDAEGNVLTLRGALTAKSRRRYVDTLEGGLHRDDAWQRATELLFEHLAASWTIAGLPISAPKELLAKFAKDPNLPTQQHIPVVVRTPNGNDYGKDLLRQHYEKYPHTAD